MNKTLIAAWVSLALNSVAVADDITLHPGTQETLRAIYQATDGDNWVNNAGWSADGEITCDAFGLSCAPDAMVYFPAREDWPITLVELRLPSNNLVGSLPQDLSQLSRLHHLDLSDNSLTGPVPSGWKTWLSFDISHNDFTGSIAEDTWSHMMTSIDASYNRISGLPAENLTYLGHTNRTEFQLFDMSHNAFTAVPAEIAEMQFWWAPGTVSFADNQLTAFPEVLTQVDGLTYLDLSHNQISGELPQIELPFTSLNLAYNQLSGELPATLLQSTNMSEAESGGLTLDFNALHSTDGSMLAFLEAAGAGDFALSQTRDPADLQLLATTHDAATLSFSAEATEPDTDGGYVVQLAQSINGPFDDVLTISDRSSSTLTIDGLSPQTDYWVRVLSFSEIDPQALVEDDVRQSAYTLRSDGELADVLSYTTDAIALDDDGDEGSSESKADGGSGAALWLSLFGLLIPLRPRRLR